MLSSSCPLLTPVEQNQNNVKNALAQFVWRKKYKSQGILYYRPGHHATAVSDRGPDDLLNQWKN